MIRLKVLSDLWNQQAQRPEDTVAIAEGECAMVPLTLWHARQEVRRSRILWLVDNSPSLHSLVKGASGNPAMDKAVAVTYIPCKTVRYSSIGRDWIGAFFRVIHRDIGGFT